MRTTITISDELLEKTMRVSKKKHYSEAIVCSIKDYLALKERLSFLEKLYTHKVPHSLKQIKRDRKRGTWSTA